MTRFGFAAFGAALMVVAGALPAAAMDDSTFLQTVIGVNLAEIQMGQLAQTNSQDAGVKAYGQMLVTDHTAANQKATALAQAANVQVPNAPSAADQDAYNQVKGLTGTDFDKMFLQDMVKGHTDAIAMFKDKADDSTNDVSSFAKDTLPTLQKHLDQANSLLQSLGGGSANTATPPAGGATTVPNGNNGATDNGGASSNDTDTTNGSAQ